MEKPKKLTRRGLFKAPRFEGHFENYYFNVVMKATASLYKDQKETLHDLLRGYHNNLKTDARSSHAEKESHLRGSTEIVAECSQQPQ